jgi:hypothetical protein
VKMVLPNEGLEVWADALLTGLPSLTGLFLVQLFKNDFRPVVTMTSTDLVRSTFTGSAPRSLLSTNWVRDPTIAGVAYVRYTTPPFWVNTGVTTELAYGWVLTADHFPFPLALACQRFDVPRNMVPGASEAINPFRFALNTMC